MFINLLFCNVNVLTTVLKQCIYMFWYFVFYLLFCHIHIRSWLANCNWWRNPQFLATNLKSLATFSDALGFMDNPYVQFGMEKGVGAWTIVTKFTRKQYYTEPTIHWYFNASIYIFRIKMCDQIVISAVMMVFNYSCIMVLILWFCSFSKVIQAAHVSDKICLCRGCCQGDPQRIYEIFIRFWIDLRTWNLYRQDKGHQNWGMERQQDNALSQHPLNLDKYVWTPLNKIWYSEMAYLTAIDLERE